MNFLSGLKRIILSALFVPWFFTPAMAQLRVDVTQGQVSPLPIALPDFAGSALGPEFTSVIRSDLERSGLFKVIEPAAYLQTGMDVNVTPKFADWRIVTAEALVVGRLVNEEGRLRAEFRLWDVPGESQMMGLQLGSTPENSRRLAHKVADAIYERLTGESGYFDTRVVFVAEGGGKTTRTKRLAIMDQDGANPSFLSGGGADLILNPRFSPNSQQIVYSVLEPRGLRVYLFDIETGRREAISGGPGMMYAPRFSPDGGSLAFSLDADGNSEVYTKNLRSGSIRRLTNSPGIDTSPSFSPDGSKIAFTSDRGGASQIYVMAASGGGASRISFGSGQYSTPVWSPNGDLIAFTKQGGGRFRIGVMKPDGSGERILSESYFEEGPTWAPSGRALMFYRETPGGSSSLWSVDVSGRNLRRVPTPGPASDPAWSPKMP